MKNSNAIFAFVVAALLAFSFGCAGKSLPGVKDTHGCIASAGYTWCKESGKCIRIWEENCTAPLFGSDRDAYGCIPSAGYSWCPELSSCVRTWETPCASKPGVRVLSENFPPFNFEAGNGTVAGRSAEIVRFMLTKMGQVAQLEVMGWPEAYQLALSQPIVTTIVVRV